jgi:superfamily II DNA or RNA helicase
MPRVRLSFDRGTLRVDGDVGSLASNHVRFDPRTGFHRAAAFRYVDLLASAAARAVDVDDAIAPDMLVPRASIEAASLRPYQEQALHSFEAFGRRGIVALPTGSGKTRVACAALARAASSTVILVPTRALLEQWVAILRMVHRAPIGIVGDGELQVEPITVMTFESAYRRLDAYGNRFGVLIVDEAHHFAGGVRAEALEMCVAPIRLGLSATPPQPGTPGADRLRDLIGPIVCELGIEDLAGSHLAELDTIRIHVVLEPDEREAYVRDHEPFDRLRRDIRRVHPGADWKTVVSLISRLPNGREILSAEQRASALATFPRAKRRVVHDLAARHWHDRTLVFTATADQAYGLGNELLVPVITAETSRAERADILERFRSGDLRMLASARVLNEGIDVPEANIAIIAGGALGAREHTQRIGRILRPSLGKRATAYELVTIDTSDEARTRARRKNLAPRSPNPPRAI